MNWRNQACEILQGDSSHTSAAYMNEAQCLWTNASKHGRGAENATSRNTKFAPQWFKDNDDNNKAHSKNNYYNICNRSQ